jgi:hypothetical protein
MDIGEICSFKKEDLYRINKGRAIADPAFMIRKIFQ